MIDIILANAQVGICHVCAVCPTPSACVPYKHCGARDEKINLTYGSCPKCIHAEWCSKHKRCLDEYVESLHG